MTHWRAIIERLQAGCAKAGLDLVHPFGLGGLAPGPADERLEDFGRKNALGVLIGNTRALWPAFRHAFRTQATLRAAAHPLDDYVTASLKVLLDREAPLARELVLGHVVEPRPYPIQRLAERAGFSAISPCQLAIRPDHGTWFGLRAVVTLDCDGPEQAPSPAARPCEGCSAPCVAAFEQALASTAQPLGPETVRVNAEAWIQVRRVCPVGQASRYGEAQLRYHYTPDPALI